MTDTSVRPTSPPGQDDIARHADEDGFLGEYHPTARVRLILRQEGNDVFLVRPSKGSRAGTEEDIAAFVTHDGDTIDVEWSQWHVQHQPVWMPTVEDWIRATIAEAGS